MNLDQLQFSPGAYIAPVVGWLNSNFHPFFAAVAMGVETALVGFETTLLFLPPYVVIAIAILAAAYLISIRIGIVVLLSLAFCLIAGSKATSQSPGSRTRLSSPLCPAQRCSAISPGCASTYVTANSSLSPTSRLRNRFSC